MLDVAWRLGYCQHMFHFYLNPACLCLTCSNKSLPIFWNGSHIGVIFVFDIKVGTDG